MQTHNTFISLERGALRFSRMYYKLSKASRAKLKRVLHSRQEMHACAPYY